MIGLILGLLYLGYRVFVEGNRFEAGFVDATTFLYYWHWAWGIFLFAIVAATMLGLTAGSTLIGSRFGRLLGGLGGAAVGGGFSVIALGLTALRLALPIGGAWLLMTAGTPAMSFAQFDVSRLVIGGIMLLISLLAGGRGGVRVTHTTTTTYGGSRSRSARRGY